MKDFMTPPKHVNFRAKKLFGAVGSIIDGAVAYIDLDGGGPTELHTHDHNHLFIVTEGRRESSLATVKSSSTRMKPSSWTAPSPIPSGTISTGSR